MVVQKKRSLSDIIFSHWKLIALVLVLLTFLCAQSCMCGQDSNDKGDGTETQEDQATQAQDMLNQIGQSYCGNTALASSALCGTENTSNTPTTACDRCPSGAAGDSCRSVCEQLSSPVIKATKLVKQDGFKYSYDISMNCLKETIYTGYFILADASKENIQGCSGISSAGVPIKCSEADIQNTKDYSSVCLDYVVEGNSKSKCTPFDITMAPIPSTSSPSGGTMIAPNEYNINQNDEFSMSVTGTSTSCTQQTGCYHFTYTSSPAINPDRFTIGEATGQIHFKPVQEDVGTYSITLTITDTNGNPSTMSIIIHVIDVNDVPSLNIPDISFNEDSGYEFELKDYTTDADPNDNTTWSAVYGQGTHLTTTISAKGHVNINSSKDWHGTEQIKFIAKDTQGASAEQKVNITVLPQTDAPSIMPPIPSQIKDENFENFIIDLSTYKHDPEYAGNNLTWTIKSFESSMITAYITDVDQLHIDSIKYADGLTTVSLELKNPDGLTATADVPVRIKHINQAPKIVNISDITLVPGEEFVLHLSDYVFDPDDTNDRLRWAVRYTAPEVIADYDYNSQTITLKASPGYNQTSRLIQIIVSDYEKTDSAWINVYIQ